MRKEVRFMNEKKNLEELAAAFNNHQITDEEGELTEETTSTEDSASLNENTEDDTATAEKSEESESIETQSEDSETETELAEDESGERYVPQKRFDKVYGEKKRLERELELARSSQGTNTQEPIQPQRQIVTQVDRTEALELEMLQSSLPQFNPESKDYSLPLDRLGATILKANPGYTRLQAAREAIRQSRELAQPEIAAQTEARKVKAIQSDQGITSRVQSRQSTQVDPSKMTLQEKEQWMRDNGMW